MDLVLVGIVALAASALTFFSGFGLGTVLVPAFAITLPVPVAVASAALVHFINNILKFGLMATRADWRTILRFGLPAAVAALAGAALLTGLAQVPTLLSYELLDRRFEVTALKLAIGVTIVLFAVLECWPRFAALAVPHRWIALGGLLSGFFGGLSGNQGALRSAFLLKAGLSKQAFVATGVVCAVIVDAVRLGVYGDQGVFLWISGGSGVPAAVSVATACALAGTLLGRRLLNVVTLQVVRRIVVVAMILIGSMLALGVL